MSHRDFLVTVQNAVGDSVVVPIKVRDDRNPRQYTGTAILTARRKLPLKLPFRVVAWDEQAPKPKHVPIIEWGRDHFSTLAYVETCVVDHSAAPGIGVLERAKMKCNPANYPLHDGRFPDLGPWDDKYSTRLKGHTADKPRQVKGHDDWLCLDDMEAEGLLEIISLVNGYVQLTDKGLKLCHQLREHKAKGGTFSNFEPDLDALCCRSE